MKYRHYALCLRLLMFSLLAMSTASCAPKSHIVTGTANDTGSYSQDRTVINDTAPRRYYRDESGKLYLIDANNNLHVIDRKVRVMPGTGGIYSIIDEDSNVRYYHDDKGRLFYRDDTGRARYIEEDYPSRLIDPLTIRGGYPQQITTHSESYCRDEWNKCMSRCNELSSRNNKIDCLQECDFKREQCLPY